MKKRIKSVSLVQNAKMMAALYLMLSLPVLLIMLAFGGMMNQPGLTVISSVVFVAAYVLSGFVFTLIGGWLYNLVAGMVGGFEFTTAEVTQG